MIGLCRGAPLRAKWTRFHQEYALGDQHPNALRSWMDFD